MSDYDEDFNEGFDEREHHFMHHGGHMGGFDQPHQPPEIIVQCKKLKNISQLQHIGSFIPLGSELSSSDLKEALSKTTLESLEKYQIVMLIYLIQPSFAPKELYDAFSSINSIFDQLPSRMQTGLAIKWVRTSILSSRHNELFNSHIIHELYEKNPDLYTAPYLYLCSATDHPEFIETNFSGDVRINAETLYFAAINKMLLAEYSKAELDLINALALSKKCRDMKDSILSKLSLCSFLNRTPEKIFRRKVPYGRTLPKIAEEIWNFDIALDTSFFPPFYNRFAQEIAYEHARGVILNLASTVTVIKLEDAQKLAGKDIDINVLLETLQAEKSLVATIKDDCIYFDDSSKIDLLSTRIQEVQQLIESLS